MLLLAVYHNDDSILIQSIELPRALPVRPSAEQAVKMPLQLLQGSGDLPQVTNSPVSPNFPKLSYFPLNFSTSNHSESAPALKMTPGSSTVCIS
jgi:hypothetical protein